MPYQGCISMLVPFNLSHSLVSLVKFLKPPIYYSLLYILNNNFNLEIVKKNTQYDLVRPIFFITLNNMLGKFLF